MQQMWFVPTIALILVLLGCASSSSNDRDRPHDAGASESIDSCGQCNDGFACTIDTCTDEGCIHLIGPNRGTTACPTGQYCTLDDGCVAALACATDTQCADYWANDACKSNIRCEAVSSVCVFDILDKDGDGHAPPVCGGGDCNDADIGIFPGSSEQCNGLDDNCNGLIDESDQGIDAQCNAISVCQDGTCVCKPENQCGALCTDTQVNVDHCGTCDHPCGTNAGPSSGWGSWSCTDGQCACSGDACDTVCTSLAKDAKNCGQCGHACATSERCQSGTCVPVHVCTKNSGTCDGDKFCRTTYPASTLGGIGVACTAIMCDCADYTYSCGEVSDWEYECYPP